MKIKLELDPLQLLSLQNAVNVAVLHMQATLGDIQAQATPQMPSEPQPPIQPPADGPT